MSIINTVKPSCSRSRASLSDMDSGMAWLGKKMAAAVPVGPFRISSTRSTGKLNFTAGPAPRRTVSGLGAAAFFAVASLSRLLSSMLGLPTRRATRTLSPSTKGRAGSLAASSGNVCTNS